ncbi:MAG TPA: plastocyanin/azurin family copper-binding protein [Longimicrobiaceae bacterium]|nr:plastocyanin/azurin family copper-binding protein [Longimicrobiaceae bacterium]
MLGLLLGVSSACGEPPAPPGDPTAAGGSQILDRITRPGDGGEVHLVRLVQRGDSYAFDPAELTIAPGDVVRFVTTGSQPESVAFQPDGATAEAAEFIRSHGLDRGALLTEPGDDYDVTFPEAPPGYYPFQSLPHAGYGMRGTIRVE